MQKIKVDIVDKVYDRLKSANLTISNALEVEDIATIIQEIDIFQAEILAQNEELIEQELMLNETKDELSLIFDNAPLIYLVLDKNNFIVKYNKLADEYFGFTGEKILNLSFLPYLKKEDLSNYFDLIYRSSSSNNIVIPVKYFENHEAKDYKLFKISANKYIKKDKQYTLLTLTDVQSEYDHMDQIETLEKEKRKSEKMFLEQSRTAAIGEMLGNIAHQWRQPLNIITTHTSLVKANIELEEEIEEKDIAQCINTVVNQAEYLSQTIDDFKDFFRADSQKNNPTRIINIMEKTESLIQSSFHNNFIECHKDLQDYSINVNQNQIMQALINICNNAKDVMSCLDPKIERHFFVSTYTERDYGVIKIKDNGGGIKQEAMGHIFEPYFTTKHPSIGTGIGLYMTHQIITKHYKGTISVENVKYLYDNNEYKGAEFTIRLPLYKN